MLAQVLMFSLLALGIVLLPFVLLYLRRRWLTGQGGLFDCAFRFREEHPGAGWVLGFARYRGEALEWFRSFSLSLNPKYVFRRTSTAYIHQRCPEGLEAIALFDDSVVVALEDRQTRRVLSLAMSRDEALALMSWLESAPPGTRYLTRH